jgi:hypothetical protein
VTQNWKSALTGAAVVILSATAGAGTASAHELSGTAKTAPSAPADRQGDCRVHLSVSHRHSGYDIRYGGSSHGWEHRGFLRITAVLTVNGHREGSVSSEARDSRDVDTPRGTDFSRSARSVKVSVRAYARDGSVSCQETRR